MCILLFNSLNAVLKPCDRYLCIIFNLLPPEIQIFPAGDYKKYTNLTAEERNQEIIKIQELIAQEHQTDSFKSKLLFDLGNLFFIEKDYKRAFNAYNEAIKNQSIFSEAWHNLGIQLDK